MQHGRLCQQFLHAGWPGHVQLWVAFLPVFLELPGGVSICHAGANHNLQLRPLQEHRAECFWQGLLRVEVKQIQLTAKTSKSETVGRKQRMSSSSFATSSNWVRFA